MTSSIIWSEVFPYSRRSHTKITCQACKNEAYPSYDRYRYQTTRHCDNCWINIPRRKNKFS